MLVAECFAFLWPVNAPMIVVDIDGTITRSDVPGLLMTLSPGILTDHTHTGICKVLSRMVDEEVGLGVSRVLCVRLGFASSPAAACVSLL